MVLLWPWSHFPSWKPHLNLLSPLLHSKRQVVFLVPSLTPFQVLSLSYQIRLSSPPTRHQLFLPSETVFYVTIIPLSPFFSSIYPATSQFHECSPLLALPFSLSCHSWASLPPFWLQAFLNHLPYWVFSYWLSPIHPKLNSGSSSQTYSFWPLVSQYWSVTSPSDQVPELATPGVPPPPFPHRPHCTRTLLKCSRVLHL